MAKRQVRLGKAIAWTDEDIDRLIEVSPEDIEAARIWWRDNAPPGFLDLLDATLDLDEDTLTDGAV